MSKKISIIIAVVLAAIVGFFIIARLSSPEDTWLCTNGEWVQHGHPSAAMPTSGCGEEKPVGLANPASTNCVDKGGTLQIEDGPNGQLGVCYFEDNRQCEEWALMRGECPVGGQKITGYVTAAGRYCAITGGTYTVTVQGDENTEKGSCAVPNGVTCEAEAYYQSSCPTIE